MCANLEEVIDAIEASAVEGVEDRCTVVARVRLTGRSDLHTDLVKLGDVGLLEEVQDRMGTSISYAVTKIEIATRTAVNREQILARRDMRSALLTRLDATTDRQEALRKCLEGLNAQAQSRLAEMLDASPELADELFDLAEQRLFDVLDEVS
jgi:hypothetical protein